MPPKRKPKGDKDGSTTDASEQFMVPPSGSKPVRNTASEESDDDESFKKAKLDSPLARRAAIEKAAAAARAAAAEKAALEAREAILRAKKEKEMAQKAAAEAAIAMKEAEEEEVMELDESGATDGLGPKSKRRSRTKKRRSDIANENTKPANDMIAKLKAISNGLMDMMFEGKAEAGLIRNVLDQASQYEVLLMDLIAQNEWLKGRLEAGSDVPVRRAELQPAVRNNNVAVPVAMPRTVVKPVETWSVVVRKKGETSKELKKKVVEEVGPTLGVRVHEVRPVRDGSVIIRTPSVAEREKIAANSKFSEIGMEVKVSDKLGPKIIVQKVHQCISPDVFMEELYSMNLAERMSNTQFKRSVRLMTAPWSSGEGEVNVSLECTDAVAEHLRATGVYIKWFRFLVRVMDEVQSCFRCLSFDHMVRECRMREEVCRRCGSLGHSANRCPNDVNCRNCSFKGLPSGHYMMSVVCPIYAARVARMKARH